MFLFGGGDVGSHRHRHWKRVKRPPVKSRSKRCILCLFFQELILPLLLLALLIAINNLNPHSYYGGISTVELEREDRSFKGLGYTPITNVTSSIMEQVAQEMSQSTS